MAVSEDRSGQAGGIAPGWVNPADDRSWRVGAGWYPSPSAVEHEDPRRPYTFAGRSREKFSKKTKSTKRKTGVSSG